MLDSCHIEADVEQNESLEVRWQSHSVSYIQDLRDLNYIISYHLIITAFVSSLLVVVVAHPLPVWPSRLATHKLNKLSSDTVSL